MSRIAFTRSAHVGHIVGVLRKQAAFNTLISSCVHAGQAARNSKGCTFHALASNKTALNQLSRSVWDRATVFEVSYTDLQHLIVSFENPVDGCISSVEFDLSDVSCVRVRLFGADAAVASAANAEAVVALVMQK